MQPQGPYTPQPQQQQPPQYQYPAPPPIAPQQPGQIPAGYEFIHNTPPPPKRSGLPQSNLGRVVAILGGLLILILIFAFARNLLSGGGNGAALTTVAQDQQAIIFIAADAQQQQALSKANKYVAGTANLGVTSDQATTITYMGNNGIKVKPKELGLKIGATTETELKDAAAASNYDAVFEKLMQEKLATYQKDLQAAYLKTSGPAGRKILDDNYKHAKLLEQQLKESTGQ